MPVLSSIALYLGLLGSALGGSVLALRLGAPEFAVVAVVTFVSMVVLLVLQRLAPHRESWRSWGTELGVDVLHGVLSTTATTAVVQAILLATLFVLADWLSGWVGLTLWPASWPVGLQVAVALVVGDLGAYWVHRAAHQVPFFWRFHVVHHSSEKLYVLSSGRNHPMNVAATYAATLIPLALLGARGEVLVLVGVFTGVQGMLQHANIDFRLGPLNWVLSGPELHRYHHSAAIEESNTNYGSNTIWWDILFGTRALPEGDVSEVGVPELQLRRNFLHHMLAPFR